MSWKTDNSCGVYAASLIIGVHYDHLYDTIMEKAEGRETTTVDGVQAGMLAAELSWLLYEFKCPNHVWYNPREMGNISGNLYRPSEAYVWKWLQSYCGVVGFQLRSRDYKSGHWAAVRGGLVKWGPTSDWKPIAELDVEENYLHTAIMVHRALSNEN